MKVNININYYYVFAVIAESSINLNMYVEIYSPLNQYLLTTLDHHVSIKYKD